MKSKNRLCCINHASIGITLLFAGVGTTQGVSLKSAVSVSTTLGEVPPLYELSNIIDKSGLSNPYTDGQEITAYIATNPFHTPVGENHDWFSSGAMPGIMDFDLGGSLLLNTFVLWNGDAFGIHQFTLKVSMTSDFALSQSVGTFTASFNPNGHEYLPDVFGFSPVSAQFVRLEISDAYGNNATMFQNGLASIGETAFGIEDVSVPSSVPDASSSFALLAMSTICMGIFARSQRTCCSTKYDI